MLANKKYSVSDLCHQGVFIPAFFKSLIALVTVSLDNPVSSAR